MTEKEIGEVRRSLRGERIASKEVCGCYANANGEIISIFRQGLAMCSEDEVEKYLAIFRKTLSGGLEKNIFDIEFTTEQVQNSEEHKLLSSLKASELSDDDILMTFYEKVTREIHRDENYVILIMHNTYDVPFKGSDGHTSDGESDSIYSFIICAVCPVKEASSALTYNNETKSFSNKAPGSIISRPSLGFLFPAFDDRMTNIYNAQMYVSGDICEDFVSCLFSSPAPKTVKEKSEDFSTVLTDALEDECSLKVLKNVHKQVCDKIEEHKLSRDPEPLAISKHIVKDVLEACGVSDEKIEKFAEKYDEDFGKGTDLSPKVIADPKKFELRTPDVQIKVSPDHSELVTTRVIDGVKYILIRADDGVEVNGINVSIKE